MDDGQRIEDKITIANKFNDFYINVGPTLAKKQLSGESVLYPISE